MRLLLLDQDTPGDRRDTIWTQQMLDAGLERQDLKNCGFVRSDLALGDPLRPDPLDNRTFQSIGLQIAFTTWLTSPK